VLSRWFCVAGFLELTAVPGTENLRRRQFPPMRHVEIVGAPMRCAALKEGIRDFNALSS